MLQSSNLILLYVFIIPICFNDLILEKDVLLNNIITLYLFSILFVSSLFSQTPDSLLNQALFPFTKYQSIEGSLKRYQFFKGKIQESAATFKFDRNNGSCYKYTVPSKLDIFIHDSGQYSIDPQKKTGFKFFHTTLPDLTDLDPVGRFFNYFGDKPILAFSGSIDSTVIFHHIGSNGTVDFSTGIHRDQKRLDFIEFFNNKTLLQQVGFSYDNDNNLKTIITRYLVGNELLKDSIVLKYRTISKSIPASSFALPSAINWK